MIIMQTVKCVLTPSFSFFISFPPKNSAMQKARHKAGFLLFHPPISGRAERYRML